ncbi:MAG: sulfotransferase [Paracoccaceae bacterium]
MARSSAVARGLAPQPDLNAIQTLFDQGEHRKALHRAKKALRLLPEHGALNALAGLSARHLGLWDEAEALLRRAVEIEGAGGRFAGMLGDLLLAMERAEDAVEVLAERLRRHPDDAVACNDLGLALTATGQFPQALTILGEAVRLAPENAEFLANLGACFERSGIEAEARLCFSAACELAPDAPRYQGMLARLEHYTGDSEAALERLDRAIARWPRDGRMRDTKAVILSALGRTEAAEVTFRSAIEVEPDNHTALANFANRFDMTDEPVVEAVTRRLLKAPTTHAVRMSLLYTLTKIEEDKGDYGAAHAALCQANAIRRAQMRYDPEQDVRMFAALKSEFAQARTPERPPGPEEVPVPIFITGLPRSGTTLTETILERHPEVTAFGELNALMHAVRRGWLGAGAGASFVEKGARVKADYLSNLPPQAWHARFVTDKMPLNFRFIGHIVHAFPQARIVHVVRDVRATCWSNFRNFFSSAGNGFSYDPDDIARYYVLYRDLMTFWEERFPGRIVTLDYDALVADPQGKTRAFIAALGLDWNEACLSPEKSQRSVLTASSTQVRRKVYDGSVSGWRRYEPFAGAWLNKLEHQAEA